jgi:hypothetical protein
VATFLAAGPARAQFRSLGGTATAAPRAAYDYDDANPDGRLYLFVRGLDGAVWYRSRSEIASNWADWKSLGSFILNNVSRGSVNGRVAAFARGRDDALWYTVRQGDGFTPWMSLGGTLTSEPVVAVVGGRPRIFVRGTDGALWYRAQMETGQWLGWRSLGGMIDGAPTVTHGSDGQLVILAQDEEGIVWQRRDPEFQTGIDPAQLWTRWSRSGATARATDKFCLPAGPAGDRLPPDTRAAGAAARRTRRCENNHTLPDATQPPGSPGSACCSSRWGCHRSSPAGRRAPRSSESSR